VSTDDAVRRAVARGAHPHPLPAGLTSGRAVVDAIADALAFPGWTGRNLDALYDALTDLSWLPEGEHVLVWPDDGVFAEHDPRGAAAVESVLRDAQLRTAELGVRVLTVARPQS
jgi:hypothetical protein